MSDELPPSEMAAKRVVLELSGMENARVRRGREYARADGVPLTLDVYRPPSGGAEQRLPAVLFVTGYADRGAESVFGCKLKDMGAYVSWAQLAAASGMAAITYANATPMDVHSVLRYLHEHAAEIGVDERRVAIWSCSGNVPNALGLLSSSPPSAFRCAVLYYGFMLDTDGFDGVARAAAQWHFAIPCAGKTAADLPAELPLLVVRAGRDRFDGVNESIDRFAAAALAANLPLTLINHARAPHAFDLFDDSESTRAVIRQTLEFMRAALAA